MPVEMAGREAALEEQKKKKMGSKSNTQSSTPVKKKRNLPGTPDPNAEVIALSPKTLMTRNRFVCEICNKGFQRDQNLQLHRRGHNLPWKLRQRTNSEVRKKVYICPEPSCVHHNPNRALGDLTGIKKHFCRKHSEKKWRCDKCSKKYAVQSDWKAHSKTCSTREYKCDCGIIFSRRDCFITHRAFCNVLAEESDKLKQQLLSSLSSSGAGVLRTNSIAVESSSSSTAVTTSSHGSMMMPVMTTHPMFSTIMSTGSGSRCTTSATALLQKATQMGAMTSSSVDNACHFGNGYRTMSASAQVMGFMGGADLFDESGGGFDHDELNQMGIRGRYGIAGGGGGGGSGGVAGGDTLTVDFLGRRK